MSHVTKFRKIQSFKTSYSPATVTQYESTRTGLRVVVVDQDGPMVYGSLALATEIHDDSGAPHTLEHLCFMGSQNYQYTGILDKLATRAYSYTNASTYTEKTQYLLESAGWEGFAQILPIYLEHILVPTITDASCYTEIQHVDGTGNDAGVVYSEMQGGENSPESLMFLKCKRMLYPEGIGFRYETFGVMESLRKLTPARIREYHRDTYQPKNLCIVIVGTVDHVNMLEVLEAFEESIVEDFPKLEAPFQRPWMDSKQAPELKESAIETIEFPEEDESSGEIAISFFGPPYDDIVLCTATTVLLTYLAGSSASVLVNTLVEKEQLTGGVDYDNDLRPRTVINFTLTSVATENLEKVEARFFEVLQDTASKPLDMKYMHDCIQRERRQVKFAAESSGKFFINIIVTDFLFGATDGSSLRAELEDLNEFDQLELWKESRWRDFLMRWMSEAPHVTVLGKPSADLSARLKSKETLRVEGRKTKLGATGLKDLESQLTAAKLENDRDIPCDVLERFKIPDTNSIHFTDTTTARSGCARKLGVFDSKIQALINQERDLPLFINFEHIQSNFAQLTVLMGTKTIPILLRPLLVVYMENFFSTPILRNSKRINFEQVIMELEKDTVSYEIDSGIGLGNPEMIAVTLQVEVEHYATAVHWLKTLMWSSVFDIDRIEAIIVKLLAEIPDEKRDGSNMVTAIELMVGTVRPSISRACSTLVRAIYLKKLKHILKKDPQTIINQLQELSDALHRPSNFRVLVVADVEKLQTPILAWEALNKGFSNHESLRPLESRCARLSNQGRKPGKIAYITPIPAIDSSFTILVSKGPSSFNDPIVPALMVATSYLNVVEGPIWTAVRGTGLAYGMNLYRHTDLGQISFEIYSSPDPLKAMIAGKEVVHELISGKREFDKFILEGAVSKTVADFANAEANKISAAQSSFVRQVIRGLPKEWPSIILEKVRNVSVEEIRTVLRDIVLPIFEPETSNLFITCARLMEEKLAKGFSELGFNLEVKPLSFFQDDYGLDMEGMADDGEESEASNDDDDDDDDRNEDDDMSSEENIDNGSDQG